MARKAKTKSAKRAQASKKAAKSNPWMKHVREYRAAHPSLSYKECLKNAKATYKK